MDNTVYKVVRVGQHIRTSCFSSGKYYLEYKVGEWVKGPDKTPLLAFSSAFLARAWSRGMTGVAIFECEAEDLREVKLISAGPSVGFSTFWNMPDRFRGETAKPPLGTVGCGRIKLLREVV